METSLTFQHNFSGDDDANGADYDANGGTDYGTNDDILHTACWEEYDDDTYDNDNNDDNLIMLRCI